MKNKKVIQDVYEILEENNIQQNDDKNIELTINYKEDKDIIGIIKIDKINFEGVVYEGTTLNILDKGVGHFKNTPLFDGNVAVAAHNSNKFWAKLKNLNYGDKIIYTTKLGTREYSVFNCKQIQEDNWSPLENTKDNIITLITCVQGQKNLRLCVQAIEI
jgi:sortase A